MDSARSAASLIAGCGLAAPEARALLAFALSIRREALIADPSQPVPPAACQRFIDLCRRRLAGEPVAYLLGEREFYGRRFAVDASVLVPRPETEGLVELALELLAGRPAPRLLDLGTGSGCIAVTLALERPDAEVWAGDISTSALQCAMANARHWQARVRFERSDWYAAVGSGFDLIACNPPYIAHDDPHLDALRTEPRAALTDEADGTTCLGIVIEGAAERLAGGGFLVVEHGFDQAPAVTRMMARHGLSAAQTRRDLAGWPRISWAKRL
jgi:release factor glutamine methyltransferase